MKPPVRLVRSAASTPGLDLLVGRRRVVRLTRRRAGIVYGPLTVLRAHSDGSTVRRSETEGKPWRKITTICGALVCTRWGSVMVQWRGFGRG